jgi:hypothetical protein
MKVVRLRIYSFLFLLLILYDTNLKTIVAEVERLEISYKSNNSTIT